MDIILIGLGQGIFITLTFGLIIFIVNKYHNAEKRPGAEQEPELVKSFKAIFSKVPGLKPEDKILGEDKGTFYSTADISFVWERVVDTLTRFPVMNDPKYGWREVKPDQPYRRIIMNASWTEKQKYVGPTAGSDTTVDYNFRLMAILQFEQLEAGGTAIHFDYKFSAADMIGERLKRGTNDRLRSICLQLTQDPTRGTPF
jgi:hypothetical protein